MASLGDWERLAVRTCEKLTAAELKALCRRRGFRPPAGDKESLTAYVAPRLLEPTGLNDAVATLAADWALVLHRIAIEPNGLRVGEIPRVLDPDSRHWADRSTFRQVCECLLDRGIVVLRDDEENARDGESRFARIVLLLPPEHRRFLPPVPDESSARGTDQERREPLELVREALIRAIGLLQDGAGDDSLLDRVARRFRLGEGVLEFEGVSRLAPAEIAARLREEWIAGGNLARGQRPWGRAAEHVLSHLPPGHGIGADALAGALWRLGLAVKIGDVPRFCEDGFRAGFLVRSETLHAAAEVAGLPREEAELAFEPTDDGIRIDLERTALAPLFEVAAASQVRVEGAELLLEPDPVRLGRVWARLSGSNVIRALRSGSKAYEKVIRQVEDRHGKLLLHRGLLLVRAEDIGLRTLLAERLGGQVLGLGGPYLCLPRALMGEAEALAKKEGFTARRVR